MAETLSLISIAAFTASGLCLIVAIILCIWFKIPSVIGDLSGRNAKKTIREMREKNEKSGDKSYNLGKVNAGKEKRTETGQTTKKGSPLKRTREDRPETGLLNEYADQRAKAVETDILEDRAATGVLQDENATVPLDVQQENVGQRSGGIPIEILEEVILIHSDHHR